MRRVETVHVDEALGQSEQFLSFQERLSAAAKVNRPVLIIGERGTGKELAAKRIHYLSSRWKEALVTLNCAAMTPTLITSELFGYEAGAFTGATGRRAGRFEAADGGTLFLDEIGIIPIEAQEKILRVVEYGSFERVGSSRSVQVDVRIVGATNSDLPAMAAEGRFKRDLLDRLSFEVLFLPPLRERKEDILLLAEHFAIRMGFELERPGAPRFSPRAVRTMVSYPWPGNIRELKNAVERAVYRAGNNYVDQIELDLFASPKRPVETLDGGVADAGKDPSPEPGIQPSPAAHPAPEEKTLPQAVRDLEIALLKRALERARYNQKRAAKILGLTYHQFRGLFRKYADELSRPG